MSNLLARYRAREDGDEQELGFTLIELLIVIVVLGVLAAVTVFALSSITGKSASAACNSDASTVNTAIAAFDAQTGYVPGVAGTATLPAPSLATSTSTTTDLIPTYLQSAPANTTHYAVSIGTTGATAGVVLVLAPGTATTPPVQWTPGSVGSAVCANAS